MALYLTYNAILKGYAFYFTVQYKQNVCLLFLPAWAGGLFLLNQTG